MSNYYYAIADTGTTVHFLTQNAPCEEITKSQDVIKVGIPNGQTMTSYVTTTLRHSKLSPNATTAHIFTNIQKLLLSISKFCDDGCTCTFTKGNLEITKNGENIITGQQNSNTGLWEIPLPLEHKAEAHNIFEIKRIQQLVTYHHKTCFSPVTSTWLTAVKNNFFQAWPGLTTQRISRHLQKSEATEKGHMQQHRQNVRSTKGKIEDCPEQPQKRTNAAFTTIYEMKKEISTDQTGKFPIRSSSNNQYIAICYDYDSNSILAKAILNRKEDSLAKAEIYFVEELTKRGMKPNFQMLDNEISQTVKKYMAHNNIEYQLVPPHIHRRNKAERAIQTFKAHFIAGLCTVHPNPPLHLWDKLMPQAIITLNMLRSSRINPGLSAYQQL